MNKFGINRVRKPTGSLPVTSWKLDNNREISDSEIRINVTMIHVEWDSFSQICHSCNFEDASVKARIIYMIERRGKLHNPYTNSGGVLTGVVDEVGCDSGSDLKPGDEIVSTTSITAIPLYIESIDYIDYDLGEIYCRGYAILFPTAITVKADRLKGNDYAMLYFDEGSALECSNRFAIGNKAKTIGIMARDIANGYIYANAVRKNNEYVKKVIVFIDKNLEKTYSDINKVDEIFDGLVDEMIIIELSEPVDSFNYLCNEKGLSELDYIILSENRDGAESLSVLLCKEYGGMFFAGVKNNYMSASLTGESMGKTVKTYSFDTFTDKAVDFAVELIGESADKMQQIKRYKENVGTEGRFGYITDHIKTNKASEVDGFIYSSKVTKAMLDEVIEVAKFDCNVIIEGETGTGKEKVLQLIHDNSKRNSMPCVKINCATISENLAESEFFGYEKGSFSGALNSGKEGYFAMANNGILFLDEISELSLNMQSKLLRVLQTNQFYKVGGTKVVNVDVRVICASNVSLSELVESGKFREDLYYRLNIVHINVPPLRERQEDVISLTEHFLKSYGEKYGITKGIEPEALEMLRGNIWNGNVRELENIIHRLLIHSRGKAIAADDVSRMINKGQYDKLLANFRDIQNSEKFDFRSFMEKQEKDLINYAMDKGRTTRAAAEILNIPQTTLSRKKIKYGIE